jgi:hypothetical protein
MIYDFIEASYHLIDKDTVNWGYLKKTGENIEYQREFYSLKGCKKIEIVYFPQSSLFKLKGSPAYYWQGHNFNFPISSFADSVNHIGEILGINLWIGFVEKFEAGLILQVPEKPSKYIKRHREGKGQTLYSNPKDRDNFRAFGDAHINRKLYDATKNILMKQGYKMQELIREQGWNSHNNYIKFENHYKRPEILNNGRSPILADLMDPEFQSIIKRSIYEEYQSLYKIKEIILPTNKKLLTTSDLIALKLIKEMINQGCTIPEVKKGLFNDIGDISEGVLSKSDKDARKRQVSTIFERVERYSSNTDWDLSDMIQAYLE